MKMFPIPALFFFVTGISSCTGKAPGHETGTTSATADAMAYQNTITDKKNQQVQTIHVFVALCDNKYQGIVPVSAGIGNGQDAAGNLYWGAAFGVKTYFTKSGEWKLLESKKIPAPNILERLLFRHKSKNIYLLADAYDGRYIQKATSDFLQACSGKGLVTVHSGGNEIPFAGFSDIITYIGHNGLMNFSLPNQFKKQNEEKRKAIILACKSKPFFRQHIKTTGAEPLLWTTGLMAPEAYILHDAIDTWIKAGGDKDVQQSAAAAYARYQKCSLKAAQNLLVCGW
jgi:hypothetical protein